MPATRKTQRRATKTIGRIGRALKKAKKHRRQAQNTVKKIKSLHRTAKKDIRSTKKGMTRKTARKAYEK